MTADWPAPTAPEDTAPEDTAPDDRGPATTTFAADPPMSPDPADPADAPRRGLSPWALIPVAGLVWWVVGFLPWILNGLRASEYASYRTAVPMFAGNLSVLVLGAGFGGLAAGATVLVGRGGRPARAAAVVAGVVLAAAVTLGTSFLTARNPSPDNVSTSDRVIIGLTLVAAVSTLVGLVWGLLALAGPVGRGLALAGAAGAAPLWISSVLDSVGIDRQRVFVSGGEAARWIGAAILVAALVQIGVRPVVRLIGWPVAIVLAWVIGPTITAAGYMEQLLRPGTVLSEVLDEQVSASWQVWRMAASLDARPLTPWIAAIVTAAVLAVALGLRSSAVDVAEQPVP